MYELNKVGEKTYYIECPAKIGVYNTKKNEVYLIDSGNDKDTAKKVLKICNENGWEIKGIINTHSNADHVGGNNYLQNNLNCKIISSGIENAITKYPILEPSFLYGGYPASPLKNKFLFAKPSNPTHDIDTYLPEGLEYIELPGHFFGMIGIKTSDDVWFLADCIYGKDTQEKYHISFMYDVKGFIQTLDMIGTLDGKLFIPSHAEVVKDLTELIKINKDKILETEKLILDICKIPINFEDLLQKIFNIYSLNMNFSQYVLVGSTVKSFLSYLLDEGKVEANFADNKLLWSTK